MVSIVNAKLEQEPCYKMQSSRQRNREIFSTWTNDNDLHDLSIIGHAIESRIDKLKHGGAIRVQPSIWIATGNGIWESMIPHSPKDRSSTMNQ
jgi:putative component of toxin-antitoxin plasmid stabilization module